MNEATIVGESVAPVLMATARKSSASSILESTLSGAPASIATCLPVRASSALGRGLGARAAGRSNDAASASTVYEDFVRPVTAMLARGVSAWQPGRVYSGVSEIGRASCRERVYIPADGVS